MSEPRFAEISTGLADAVRAHDDMIGLAFLGSASDSAAARRDQWSDHDFFAITTPGRGALVRPDLSWLPDPHRIVLTAREGDIGFVAVYDDARVLEFALADAAELSGALADAATVVVDDDEGSTASLIASARARARARDEFDPANDVRLVLVKLLIGTGRARRGETLAAGSLVRQWAVEHLVRAIRGRRGSGEGSARDIIDPVRRFDVDFPSEAARIAAAAAAPVEVAAEELFALTREFLEPGWEEFPTTAADAVARRLGWEDRPIVAGAEG